MAHRNASGAVELCGIFSADEAGEIAGPFGAGLHLPVGLRTGAIGSNLLGTLA